MVYFVACDKNSLAVTLIEKKRCFKSLFQALRPCVQPFHEIISVMGLPY